MPPRPAAPAGARGAGGAAATGRAAGARGAGGAAAAGCAAGAGGAGGAAAAGRPPPVPAEPVVPPRPARRRRCPRSPSCRPRRQRCRPSPRRHRRCRPCPPHRSYRRLRCLPRLRLRCPPRLRFRRHRRRRYRCRTDGTVVRQRQRRLNRLTLRERARRRRGLRGRVAPAQPARGGDDDHLHVLAVSEPDGQAVAGLEHSGRRRKQRRHFARQRNRAAIERHGVDADLVERAGDLELDVERGRLVLAA